MAKHTANLCFANLIAHLAIGMSHTRDVNLTDVCLWRRSDSNGDDRCFVASTGATDVSTSSIKDALTVIACHDQFSALCGINQSRVEHTSKMGTRMSSTQDAATMVVSPDQVSASHGENQFHVESISKLVTIMSSTRDVRPMDAVIKPFLGVCSGNRFHVVHTSWMDTTMSSTNIVGSPAVQHNHASAWCGGPHSHAAVTVRKIILTWQAKSVDHRHASYFQ